MILFEQHTSSLHQLVEKTLGAGVLTSFPITTIDNYCQILTYALKFKYGKKAYWECHMNVNLGETFDQFIADLIKSGLYQSQSEVVREGLRLLKEREDLRKIRIAQLRAEIDQGIVQIESGKFETHDGESLKKALQASKSRGRKRLAEKKARVA